LGHNWCPFYLDEAKFRTFETSQPFPDWTLMHYTINIGHRTAEPHEFAVRCKRGKAKIEATTAWRLYNDF